MARQTSQVKTFESRFWATAFEDDWGWFGDVLKLKIAIVLVPIL